MMWVKKLLGFDARRFPNQHIKKMVLLAEKHKWDWIDFQPISMRIGFRKHETSSQVMIINVYTATMNVETWLNHPLKGRTRLSRNNITPGELEKIFINPRTHIGKGYYEHTATRTWKKPK